MNLPKISVVTPSYNQTSFIERTILSVLNQKYPNLEYIIIDGGSTDGSVDIIKRYSQFLSYWVSEPDQGQADAINKGFLRSSGEILAWLNSDDMYLPGALHRAAAAFAREPKASIIYGDYIKVDENDKCIALRRQPSFSYNICFFGYLTVMQPAAFFRRQTVFDVGLLDTSFHCIMDYDLIVKLARRGKVIHIPGYLAAFRLHPESKSVTIRPRFREESRRMRIDSLGYDFHMGLFLRFHYYKTHALLRMLFEGCLPSRFGIDDGKYKLNEVYTPKKLEF